jgi:enoyl-CoA hydratase/carnithine racemase
MPSSPAGSQPANSTSSEYALLADVVIASDTTVFSDMPHFAFGIAPGDGLVVVWEEALGLNRTRYLVITQGSFTAHQALEWGAVAEVVPLGQVLPRAQELAEQMTQRPHFTNKYMAVVFRQRISRRLAEGMLAERHRRQPRLCPAGLGKATTKCRLSPGSDRHPGAASP